MKQYKSRFAQWSSRSGRIFLVFLLAITLVPFMGAGKTARAAAATPTWTSVGAVEVPPYVQALVDVDGTLYAGTNDGSDGISNDVWMYSNGTWTQMSGSPSQVTSLVGVNGSLYAGTSGGVYMHSDDEWTRMSDSPVVVTSLVADNGTLYAGTISSDNGPNEVWMYDSNAQNPTWTPMTGSPYVVNTLLYDNGTLYAGGGTGIYKYNSGDGWTRMSQSPSEVRSLVAVDGTLYVGTDNGSSAGDVWTYNNTDEAWQRVSGSPYYVTSLVNVNGTLYVGTGDKVSTYSNGTWTQISGSPYGVSSMIYIDGTLYVGRNDDRNTVWTYYDGTWTLIGGSPPAVNSMIDVSSTLYAGTDYGVWIYSSGAWTRKSGGPDYVHALVYVGSTLYAAADNKEWSYSNGTWTQMSDSPSNVYSMIDVNGTLYAGDFWGSVWTYNSNDEVLTWTQMVDSPSFVTSLVDVDGTLYAGTSRGVWTYNRNDEVPTWTQMDNSPSHVWALLYVNDTLFAGQWSDSTNEVWKYSGGTWTQMGNSPSNVSSLVDVNGTLYAGTDNDSDDVWTYNLDDANATWGSMSGSPSKVYSLLYANSALYAGGSHGVKQLLFSPGTPANLLADRTTSSSTTLSWDAMPGAAGYHVYKNGDQTPIARVTGAAYTVGDLTPNTSYTFTVSAFNAAGESAQSGAIQITTLSSAKAITAFNFAGLNPAVNGTVNETGKTIALTVPFGTNVTALVPTFTTTGASVKVGNDMQLSGATAQNFTNPVTYTVVAADGSTQDYVVTVNVASSTTSEGGGGGGSTISTSDTQVTSSDGKLTLPANRAGEVNLDDAITVSIPSGATQKELKITIEKLVNTQNLQMNKGVLVSQVYEILKNFQENFDKPVTLTFKFDPANLKAGQKPVVYYYDEAKKEWVKVGGTVNGNHITAQVNHFTKFAVFAEEESPTNAEPVVQFSDILGHWAEAAIKKAVSLGIAKGYPDGTFNPNRTVTRAEFAVMLMNALKPQVDGAALTFTDKGKIGKWAQKSVAQAVQAGIIAGYKDGTFRPDAEITRSEMAVMIAKALGQSVEATTATGFADDKDIPDWANGAVGAMKKLSIIEGKGANAFAPGDKTTRAESVTVLLKMLAQKGK
ncbi:S-layer homology domain-containing protein [Cohnella silvisoli]|uniref:S-layer homology domain-containing protein n=1 Tax=Cohnella silvisoli TaxID=2873699 RepID=A0ABV1KZJ4_9BACL|nr:S-layer homology domain-containing protein [Cohnella silvisoli]MCD9024799.1 S-layer homology domain-containing protein [Cohnella silvisoli]